MMNWPSDRGRWLATVVVAGSVAAASIHPELTGRARAQTQAELERYQQRLDQLFQRLDRNRDQRLNKQEVQNHPYLQRHFDRLDRLGHGYLSPEDLSHKTRPQWRKRMLQLFNEEDRNKNGLLERSETINHQWLQKRFDAIDADKDGRLSPNEVRQTNTRSTNGID